MDLDALCDAVKEGQGVQTLPMRELRHMGGCGNVGVDGRERIRNVLRARGLRYLPRPLPENCDEYVRVYNPDTVVGKFIAAAVNCDPDADETLREIDREHAAETIERIKELLSPVSAGA